MAFTHLPLRRTAPFGAAAYLSTLAGVALVYLAAIPDLLDRVTFTTGGGPGVTVNGTNTLASNFATVAATPPDRILIGWAFYNAQLVTVGVPVYPGVDALRETNLVWSAGGVALILFALPPLTLTLAGYVAGCRVNRHGRTRVYAGASIAVGYVPLVILGVFVFAFRYQAGPGATPLTSGADAYAYLSPNPLTALTLGTLYPAVFGALGGASAAQRSGRQCPILQAFPEVFS